MSEATKKAKGSREREPRRRKPDALARAEAEVDAGPRRPTAIESVEDSALDVPMMPAPSPADVLESAAAMPVAPAGVLVEMPAPGSRSLVMADLPALERRALAAYGANFHRTSSQVEAFEDGRAVAVDLSRALPGTSGLVRRGLLVERRAYFLTPLGERVAATGGITVTRHAPPEAEPVKAAS